jgi:hypothetical protein
VSCVYGGTVCVSIDVPEETALPYESPLNDKPYRRFRMPADIANGFDRRLATLDDFRNYLIHAA